MLKPIQKEGLQALIEADAVKDVLVIASAIGFTISVNDQFVISNRQKQPRAFGKAETVFFWLAELGITRIEVDLSKWGRDD